MERPILNDLTEQELEFFASMTYEECENYRAEKYERYTLLKLLVDQVNKGIIDEINEKDLIEFKVIMWYNPYPNDACQQLKILRGEPCEECGV